jgi:MoxR-like ATPase
MMKSQMTYPTADEEQRMLHMLAERGSDTPDFRHPEHDDTISIADVEFLRSASRRVHISDSIVDYAVDLVATSRGAGKHPIQGLSSLVRLGASPRASIALVRIAQANALIAGRDYVIPEDVKLFAHEVLRHRILLTFEALADDVSSDQVIDSMLQAVPVP